MAIPKKIIDLTTLALQDRVLTYKERETIVTEWPQFMRESLH